MEITNKYRIVPFQEGGKQFPSFDNHYTHDFGLTIQNHPRVVISWLECLYGMEILHNHCPAMRQVNNFAFTFGNEKRVDEMKNQPDIITLPNETKIDTWDWSFIPLSRRYLPFSPTGYDQPITFFYSFRGQNWPNFQVKITAIFSSYGEEIVTTKIWNVKDDTLPSFNCELINNDESLICNTGKVWRKERLICHD